MKNNLLALTVLLFSMLTYGQTFTIDDIYGSTFRTQRMEALQSLPKSNKYTVVNSVRGQGSQIDVYDFATLQKIETIFETRAFANVPRIDSYNFSADEKQLLIGTESESIFRHSAVANYFWYDISTKKLLPVASYKIQEPTFSPNGKFVAYGYQNNLYIWEVATQKTTQITSDGKKNHIINGITDWVYEEEFGFVRAFDWNAASTHIGFIRFDETNVPEFSMDVYGTELYPTQEVFKYPKAGEVNAKVSLHVYEVANNKTAAIDLSAYNDFYIARLQWSKHADKLTAQILNRHQNVLDLWSFDVAKNTRQLLLKETDNAYVDVDDDLTFLDDHSFLWTSERDGFKHIYHYAADGKLIRQITKGTWEVTQYYGYQPETKTLFYQSVQNGSTQRGVYRISLNGKNIQPLAAQLGTNKATFSPTFSHFINQFSDVNTPPVYTLHDSKNGTKVKDIIDNKALLEKLAKYDLPTKEFFEMTLPEGHKVNAYIIKPKDFDASKKYPLLMFQYSGPGSQQVANQWLNTNDYWHMHLAQLGYIVACVDGRGTGYKGAAFKKVTQKQLGKYEVEDQIAAAKQLATYPYIDKNRIGIWGWSYGGFMSSNCILLGNDVFKTAIAVAPVTQWRFYDTIYTERYMTTPQENPSGYDDNSPITHVNKLKGNYLIIHGTADDNVHVQNAMRMIRALQLANKPFEQAIYPDTNHGIYGGKIRVQLYNFMTDYLKRNL